MSNKRLLFLEQMLQSGQADSFARYALGMEYRKEGRVEEALRTFSELRALDENYVPQYLMAGQMLLEAGRTEEGKSWLSTGIEVARRQGDSHAESELEAALASA